MSNKLLGRFLVGFLTICPPAFSHESLDLVSLNNQIKTLQYQNRILQERLETLESRLANPSPLTTSRIDAGTAHIGTLNAGTVHAGSLITADNDQASPKSTKTPWLSAHTIDGSTLTLNGQINRALWFADNGRRSELKHLDNNQSSTRLTFRAERPFGPDTQVGAIIEGELGGNNTSNTDIGQNPTTTTLAERKLEGFVQTRWGELWIGQGETAAHRVTDVDLSGTTVISEGAEFQAMTGGVRFVRGSFPENVNAPTDRDRSIGDTYSEILGSSRKNRVRYITPSYHGLTASLSHATRDYSDFSLRYDGALGATKLAAAAGYAHNPFGGKGQSVPKFGRQDYGGSFSVLFPVGVSVGGAVGRRHFNTAFRKDGRMWGTRLGYQRDFFSWGKSALSLAYGQGHALFDSAPSVDSAAYSEDNTEKIAIRGAYFVQHIDPLWTEFYLGYQHHDLRRDRRDIATGAAVMPGYDFKGSDVFMTGARVRF